MRPWRTAAVVNAARVAHPRTLEGRLRAALDRAGCPAPIWLETTSQDTGALQARAAVASGAEVVFACGGDGTIASVASALAGSGVALAVIPQGTGNLLVRNLQLPRRIEAVVAAAVGGRRKTIDLGRIEDRVFTVAAGMGFDAVMLAGATKTLKRRLGWPAYLVSGLHHLAEEPFTVELWADGVARGKSRVRSVLVVNLGHLQFGTSLIPDARGDDGQLDVALIAPETPLQWGLVVASLFSRGPRSGVDVFAARSLRVVADSSQPCEVDGGLLGERRELAVEVWPSCLTVCVPAADARSARVGW